MKWALFLLSFLISPLYGRNHDDYATSQMPEMPVTKFTHDYVDGGFRGEFIQKPNLANILGNLTVNFTPAAPFADARDLFANVRKMVQSNFTNYKTDVALGVGGFVPFLGEAKKFSQAYEAGKEARLLSKLTTYAPAVKSGFTYELQAAFSMSLKEGEVLAIRPRVYGANFFDGKLPVKEAGAVVKREYANGVRKLEDGTRVISDVDIAFAAKNAKLMPEDRALQIGEKINNNYGHTVIVHGDNYNGARRGIEKAIDIEKKNDETIYLFNNKGFLDAGDYQSMLRKWGRRP